MPLLLLLVLFLYVRDPFLFVICLFCCWFFGYEFFEFWVEVLMLEP